MKLLARFDSVFADSRGSGAELRDYWRWIGVAHADPVVIPLGADGQGVPRITTEDGRAGERVVTMLGILEPRKNQSAVLDAAEQLWSGGLDFFLFIAGRINPHFGRPIARRIRALRRDGRPLQYEESLDDASVAKVFAKSRFTVLPSLAEGCGLPALESLWSGVPVVCSDVPALVETAAGGGCRVVQAGDVEALRTAMHDLLTDENAIARLTEEAITRALPTWSGTAAAILAALG